MAVLTPSESIQNAIGWLEEALRLLKSVSTEEKPTSQLGRIAWGSKVSPEFKARVLWMGDSLGCDPSWLMACMAWEDAETFKPDTKNAAGSGAIGLIQFMPTTAIQLGTTVQALSKMTAEDQLQYVYRYFQPYAGRLHNLGDVYMAILWPKGVGQPDDYVLFDRAKTPVTFRQNAGLDINRDGHVTRNECTQKVKEKLLKGMQYVG